MQRHTLLALAVFIITSLIGFLYLHVRYATNYLGQAIVYVSPSYPKTLNADPETDHTGDYGTFIDEQLHSVNRIDIMVDAIRRMPPGIWRHAGETEQSAAQRLAGALEVQRVAETYQISIGLHGSSPEHLAEVVNAVAERAYVAASHNEEFYGRDARLKGLQDERDHLQSDLTARLAEQTALLKDLGLGSIDANTVNPYNLRIEKLNTDLLAAREARQVAETQFSSFHDDSDQGTTTAIHSEAQELAQADQGLIAFKETLNERRAKLVSDIAGMKPDNPVYKTDQEELGGDRRCPAQDHAGHDHRSAVTPGTEISRSARPRPLLRAGPREPDRRGDCGFHGSHTEVPGRRRDDHGHRAHERAHERAPRPHGEP